MTVNSELLSDRCLDVSSLVCCRVGSSQMADAKAVNAETGKRPAPCSLRRERDAALSEAFDTTGLLRDLIRLIAGARIAGD
jgi:hypothetical protein